MTSIKPPSFLSAFNGGNGKYIGALLCGPNWELINRLKLEAISSFTGAFPEGEIIRLADSEIASDPGKLLEELQSISMFGTTKLIVADVSSSAAHKACIGAVSQNFSEAFLLISAGDLKKSSPLRKEFEAAPSLIAAVCYEQSRGDLVSVAKGKLQQQGVDFEPDVVTMLVDNVEGNAALLDSELEKLIAFIGPENQKITIADFLNVIAGNEAKSIDDFVDAIFESNNAACLKTLDVFKQSGQQPSTLLIALNNHLVLLMQLAAEIGNGQTASRVVKSFRPPIFFKRQDAIIRHLRNQSSEKLQVLSDRLLQTSTDVRKSPNMAWELTERFALSASSFVKSRTR